MIEHQHPGGPMQVWCVECQLWVNPAACPTSTTVEVIRPLDLSIGRLDRCLSEFLIHAEAARQGELDEADRQTLKHHADDLIGVGRAAHKRLHLELDEPPAFVLSKEEREALERIFVDGTIHTDVIGVIRRLLGTL